MYNAATDEITLNNVFTFVFCSALEFTTKRSLVTVFQRCGVVTLESGQENTLDSLTGF